MCEPVVIALKDTIDLEKQGPRCALANLYSEPPCLVVLGAIKYGAKFIQPSDLEIVNELHFSPPSLRSATQSFAFLCPKARLFAPCRAPAPFGVPIYQ